MTNKEVTEQKTAAYIATAIAVAEAKAAYLRSKADTIVEQARAAAEIKAEQWNQKAEKSITCRQAVLWMTKADAAVKLAVQLAEIQANGLRVKADALLVRARAVAEAQAASYWPIKATPSPTAEKGSETEDAQYIAFKALLVETLSEYFSNNPAATEWRGTASRMVMEIHINPKRKCATRLIRLERASKFLEQIRIEGVPTCRRELGPTPRDIIIWIFPRFEAAITAPRPLNI